ncbi:MAG: hypothetical protein KY476_14200, partial [Planctomycetes bacterium]|nr:hypothetical protein [Planctomycetota bacterium]
MDSDHAQSATAAPPALQARVDKLQSALAEKEKLVAALTARLEQAAEQLDRIRRSGGDRGSRVVSGGIPAELVEQQKGLVEELQAAVAAWQDMQAAACLGRIERGVDEVRDLLTGSALPRGQTPLRTSDAERGEIDHPQRGQTPSAPVHGDDLLDALSNLVGNGDHRSSGSSPEAGDEGASDSAAAWEAMKADLLGDAAHAVPPLT